MRPNFLTSLTNTSLKNLFICLELSQTELKITYLANSGSDFTVKSITTLPVPKITFYDSENESAPPNELEKLVSSQNLPSNSKFIILGDSSWASTTTAWVQVTREDYRREVDEGELENIISQAVWKFLNHYRPSAMKKLDISDADVLLANIRILGVRINNHKVLNPLGFKAKTIEFLIEETFVNRDYYRSLAESLPSKSEIIFLNEIGVIESLSLLRHHNFNDSFSLIRLLPKRALIISALSKVRFNEKITNPIISIKQILDWDNGHINVNLAGRLSLDGDTAGRLISLYNEGDTSPKVSFFIKEAIDEAQAEFIKSIKKSLSAKFPVFLLSDYSLPNNFFKAITPKSVDMLKIISTLGLNIDNTSLPISTAIAALSEYELSKENETLNKLAARRAKWLIP